MQQAIQTTKAPAPIGPYSQAVVAGNFLFISGQIAINPETGHLELENLDQETRRVMKNLKGILEAASAGFENVVKSSIFLSDMNDFSRVNEIYASYFTTETPPARETVQVSVLPKHVNVEISMIAMIA